MPPSNDPDDVDMPMTASDRPFIVTLSAQAIGSVGFGLVCYMYLIQSICLTPLAEHSRHMGTVACPIGHPRPTPNATPSQTSSSAILTDTP